MQVSNSMQGVDVVVDGGLVEAGRPAAFPRHPAPLC
jgi:hypothetical protein